MIYDLSKLSADLRNEIEASPKWRALFSKKPDSMLRLDGNAKTVKGNKHGFKTAILYMAPANMSGINLCPMAFIAECDSACLFTAGRGAMSSVAMSRLRKALFFQQFQGEALALLMRELIKFRAKAQREGWTLLVRLNGTTDIRWENYGLIQSFPDIQFYDYTKIANRKNVPANYDLTFSYSGVAAYAPFVRIAAKAGQRIAVVFRSRDIVDTMLANGETFIGMQLVDGDDTDIRHVEPQGVVVALYAKGKGKLDQTGFVVDAAPVALAMAA
jgi:hypothetical protein